MCVCHEAADLCLEPPWQCTKFRWDVPDQGIHQLRQTKIILHHPICHRINLDNSRLTLILQGLPLLFSAEVDSDLLPEVAKRPSASEDSAPWSHLRVGGHPEKLEKNMKKHGTIVPQQPMPPVWGFGTQKIIDLPSLSHGFQMVSVPEGPSTELRTSNQCHTPQSESGNQRMVHCTHCGIVVSTVTCGSYLTWPGWGMPPLTQVVPKCRIGTGSKLHHSCHSSYPIGSASQNGNKG